MSITGGIKILEKSKFLFTLGSQAFSLSGENTQPILNHNRKSQWASVGSDDTIKQSLVVELDQEYSLDRLVLNGHNFKDVTIYMMGTSRLLLESGDNLLLESGDNLQIDSPAFGVGFRFIVQESASATSQDILDLEQGGHIRDERFQDFSFVPTDLGLQRTLTGAVLASSTKYFEFDTTRVSGLLIEATTTQVANAEKFLKVLLGSVEIGTFEGFPAVSSNFNRNIRTFQALAGKAIIQKGFEAANIVLAFQDYPGQADATLIELLQDSDEDFIIWLCGGREGSDFFRFNTRGWGIDDLYLGNLTSPLPYQYSSNVYIGPYNTNLDFSEVTG